MVRRHLGGLLDRVLDARLHPVARRAETGTASAVPPNGKVFCLVEAPDADAAITVHREAHGLVADKIYAVIEGA